MLIMDWVRKVYSSPTTPRVMPKCSKWWAMEWIMPTSSSKPAMRSALGELAHVAHVGDRHPQGHLTGGRDHGVGAEPPVAGEIEHVGRLGQEQHIQARLFHQAPASRKSLLVQLAKHGTYLLVGVHVRPGKRPSYFRLRAALARYHFSWCTLAASYRLGTDRCSAG